MKYTFIAVLMVSNSLVSSAQKHNLFADAGLSLAYFDPGFSATYNYNPVKYIGIGAGAQAYVFHPAKTSPRHFTPAVFGDLRLRIRPEKISQYYVLLDVGMNFYKHSSDSAVEGNNIYYVPNDNGIYFGIGIGYFLRLTYRGWGPYITVKAINNSYKRNQLNIATGEASTLNTAGGTLVISLGFRFGDDTKMR